MARQKNYANSHCANVSHQDPKYSNKVWQKAYFNAPKDQSHAQKMAAADAAYAATQDKPK